MNDHIERCYIALGSNLNNPIQQVQSGIKAITVIPNTTLIKQSHLYRNPALYPPPQPEYINAVIAIDTFLTAHELLSHLQKIEHDHGRVQTTVRFGPRTLDLDLLLYGDLCINTAKLVVPHPGITQRNFVLYPLSDIAPDLHLPSGTPISKLLLKVSAEGLERIDI